MNVTLIAGSISREAGGLFSSVRGLSGALASLPRTQVSVISFADAFSSEDASLWKPLVPKLLRPVGPRAVRYAPGMGAAIHATAPHIVHCHGVWQFQSWGNYKFHQMYKTPFLISPRGMLDEWALNYSRWKKRIARWLFEDGHLQNASCLHALCESEHRAIRAFGLKNPVAIIPNGIDLPEMQNAESRMQNPPWEGHTEPGQRILLYLGRIHPKKGLANLLRAWAALQKTEDGGRRAAEWELAIAGWDQGGHEAELKQLATELGIAWTDIRKESSVARGPSSVTFLGPQFGDGKAACCANCDAFILPSFSEGLPMAVLEAWAYAKPVLMTPECNLPEGFAANAAIRTAPGAESIARGLEDLFRAPYSALRTLGDNGRRLVASRFTWPGIAREMKTVYEWVLGCGSRPACVTTA